MQHVPKGDADLERCKAATGVPNDTDVVRFCDGFFFLKSVLRPHAALRRSGLARRRRGAGIGLRLAVVVGDEVRLQRPRRCVELSLDELQPLRLFKYVGAEHPIP